MELRLRGERIIIGEELNFMPATETNIVVFAIRNIIKRYREIQRKVHAVFFEKERLNPCYRDMSYGAL